VYPKLPINQTLLLGTRHNAIQWVWKTVSLVFEVDEEPEAWCIWALQSAICFLEFRFNNKIRPIVEIIRFH